MTLNNAIGINGISPELTQAAGPGDFNLAATFTRNIWELALIADYAVAFNAEFDAPLVNRLLSYDALDTDLAWLCAMRDFDWGYPNAKARGKELKFFMRLLFLINKMAFRKYRNIKLFVLPPSQCGLI